MGVSRFGQDCMEGYQEGRKTAINEWKDSVADGNGRCKVGGRGHAKEVTGGDDESGEKDKPFGRGACCECVDSNGEGEDQTTSNLGTAVM